jgi:hypothetical protein
MRLVEVVHKNLSDNETLAKEGGGVGGLLGLPNLTAYKDPVVVFGSVAADPTDPSAPSMS